MEPNIGTPQEMSGSQIVWTMLQEEGVEYVFGVSGITNVPLLHALKQMPSLKFIHAAHEDSATGMADGYSRATGKLAVVVVHNVAGASNTLGNLHNAFNAGSRILVIAGQNDAPIEWSERYMDVDFRPMMSQVTKGCWVVTRGQDLPLAVNRAIKEANTAPTGPVFLAIPTNIQAQTITYFPLPPQGRRVAMAISPEPGALKQAAQLLASAKNPLIFAGRAVADADAVGELVKLAETLAAPVYTCLETKLIFPTSHPLYGGRKTLGADALRTMAASADVLLTVGSNLFLHTDCSETPVVPASTKVIQIDLEPHALARYCPTEVALLADPKSALSALAAAVEGSVSSTARQERWDRVTSSYRQKKDSLEACLNKDWQAVPIGWGAAFREICASLPENAAVVEELATFYGQFSKIAAFREPGSYFTVVDHLGWGLPATLGVALGSPRKPVIGVLGDGTSLFAIQAFWTAARYQIPAVMVILNNGGYGCMRGLFMMYGMTTPPAMTPEDCASYDISGLNFTKLAAEFGIEGRRVTEPTGIRSAIKEAIARNKPAVVEIIVSPDLGTTMELYGELTSW